ncbi:trigger factor [Candidatus Parcubacteria bacterium]|nr:trigger factor [Candidatus Parcubacteria bacterium]
MKTTIKKLPKSQIEILFEISEQKFNNYYQKALAELSKNLKADGFRQGKVPQEIAEKQIGQGKILNEAAEIAIKENYIQAISEKKIEAIDQPNIEILKLALGNPFEFKAMVPVLPEIDLSDYKKIASQVRKRQISVEEKEIEDGLKWLQKSRAKLTLKNQSAQKGDWVEIKFRASNKEIGFDEPERKDAFLLGQGGFIPGFEEKLQKMSANEEKEFSLIFPEDYIKKEYAGKKADFWVKVESVQKMELAELNDEFAKNLGKFENLDDLKKNIRQGLEQEKKMKEKQKVRQEILDKINDSLDFGIPEILIQREKDQMIENLKQKISQDFKISFEKYLSEISKSEEELKKSFSSEAEKKVRNFLILREIGKKEDIKVSDAEIEQEINKVFKNYPDIEAAKKEIDHNKLKMYYKDVIHTEKIFQLLEQNL